jgi:hypothetical protein
MELNSIEAEEGRERKREFVENIHTHIPCKKAWNCQLLSEERERENSFCYLTCLLLLPSMHS